MAMLGKPKAPDGNTSISTTLNLVHKTVGQYFKSHVTNEELCQTQHTASQWVIRQVLVQWKQPRKREGFV